MKNKTKRIGKLIAGMFAVLPCFALASCDFETIKSGVQGIIGGLGETNEPDSPLLSTEGVMYDDFQMHFLTLGNENAGDSIYIKAGETDILIDAGSRANSYETTSTYINQYCKDNKLEYAIMTHGDRDHIDSFPKFFENYEVEVVINNEFTNKTTSTYTKVLNAIDNEVSNGAKHYFASDCWNETNGAKREYQLSDNVTMNIIYNKYYFEKTSSENDYSVCTLFTYTKNGEEHNFLLTGDLELKGETSIADYYDGTTVEKTLPKVDLFKAGHHGSVTSSNDCLLEIIQPKMCVVTCCCGVPEYTTNIDNQFPTQEFIDRIAKWTDSVYVTSIFDTYTIETAKADADGESDTKGIAIGGNYIKTEGYKDMNGNIVVSAGLSDGEIKIGLACSNNTTKLKDSEWFNTKIVIDGVERQMRKTPAEWLN